MAHIIGTSKRVVDDYLVSAEEIFHRIRGRMQEMVVRAFALTYEGPDAEVHFNPGLVALTTDAVGRMDEAMVSFATALGQVTANISRALGGETAPLVYQPRALELPPPPGVAADDYRIDVAAFDAFITGELADLRTALGALIDENQQAFNAIPPATVDAPGWSGRARDHAQQVVVPAQSEQLRTLSAQIVEQLTAFMAGARDAAVNADQAGVIR
ncbi:MAG: hypothetical protein AAGD35_02860 [Actinomycetota bacterium]